MTGEQKEAPAGSRAGTPDKGAPEAKGAQDAKGAPGAGVASDAKGAPGTGDATKTGGAADKAKVVVAGKYVLEDLLSEDATGRLYQAVNRDTKRGVLVKVYAPEVSSDSQGLERIAEQVQALVAARCDHHIGILDMEMPRTPDDPAVLVLERARGETLGQRLDRMGGRLGIPDTCQLFLQVLRGLEAAHNAGVAPIGCEFRHIFLTQSGARRDFVKIRGPILPSPKPRGGEAMDVLAAGRVFFRCLTGEYPKERSGSPEQLEEEIVEKSGGAGSDPEQLRKAARICARCLTGGYATAAMMSSDIERAGLAKYGAAEDGVSFDTQAALAGAEDPSLQVEVTQPTLRAKFRPAGAAAAAATGAASPRAGAGPVGADPAGAGRTVPPQEVEPSLPVKPVVVVAVVVGLSVGVGVTLLAQLFSKGDRKAEAPAGSAAGPGAGAAPGAPAPQSPLPRARARPAASRAEKELSLGIAYYYPDQKVRREMLDLGVYLKKRTGRRIRLKDMDYRQVGPMLEEGRLDLAVFTPYLYVQARKKYKKFRLLGTHLARGRLAYEGYLVVLERSPVRSIKDLKGQRACFVSEHSTSGYLFPAAMLRRRGLDPERDFKNIRFSGTHHQAAEDLKHGVCDVAAMGADLYLKKMMQGTVRLRVVAVTERIPSDAYCASPAMSEETVDQIKKALVAFDPRKDLDREYLGERHLIAGFVVVGDRYFDPIRRMMRFLKPETLDRLDRPKRRRRHGPQARLRTR